MRAPAEDLASGGCRGAERPLPLGVESRGGAGAAPLLWHGVIRGGRNRRGEPDPQVGRTCAEASPAGEAEV